MPLVEWHDLKHVGRWGEDTSAGQPQIFEDYRASTCKLELAHGPACYITMYTGETGLGEFGLWSRWLPMVTRARAEAGDDVAQSWTYERLAAWVLNPEPRRQAVDEWMRDWQNNTDTAAAAGEQVASQPPDRPLDNFVCVETL